VSCSQKTLDQAPEKGSAWRLWIETIVREEYIQLYGFCTQEEQTWFNTLLTIQGVGMKAALSILSALEPGDIYQAIVSQNATPLTQADGVGPKLAARVVNELKGKKLLPSNVVAFGNAHKATPASSDAVSALVNLGYRPADAAQAVNSIAKEAGDDLQKTIRLALAKLNQQRA
jgi:Holliday junction DNA helicase RuvA